MAKVCSKCGNNLYGNKTKCPFCGEPIRNGGSTSRSSSSYSNGGSNNNLSSRSYNNNNSNNNNDPYASYSGNNRNNNNNSNRSYNNNNSYQRPQRSSSSADTGGAGWGLLGFCVPLVGIILYLVWQEERPYTAKACLNGALIAILIWFVFGLFASCGSMAGY